MERKEERGRREETRDITTFVDTSTEAACGQSKQSFDFERLEVCTDTFPIVCIDGMWHKNPPADTDGSFQEHVSVLSSVSESRRCDDNEHVHSPEFATITLPTPGEQCCSTCTSCVFAAGTASVAIVSSATSAPSACVACVVRPVISVWLLYGLCEASEALCILCDTCGLCGFCTLCVCVCCGCLVCHRVVLRLPLVASLVAITPGNDDYVEVLEGGSPWMRFPRVFRVTDWAALNLFVAHHET